MKQFMTFVKKEFRHAIRDRKTLLILFGMPIVQILLFGFALTNEVKNSKIVICDYAKDDFSRKMIGKFTANSNFIVTEMLLSHDQIAHSFKKGDIALAIVFPLHFGHDLLHLNEAQVQIIADASDPNKANILTAYATNILRDSEREFLLATPLPYSITTKTRMLYNPELKGATNFVPGVMALVLMLICVMMTSVSIVREKEYGTMELLLASPISPLLFIIAKALPYLLLSVTNLSIILLMSIFLLDIPLSGSLLLFFGVSILFVLAALSLGLLISNTVASQQAAILVSLVGLMVPTIIFTGFAFPIENMPVILQYFANIVPSKWYYSAVKSIMIKGLGIEAIGKEVLVLTGMALLLLFVSVKKFKTRLT